MGICTPRVAASLLGLAALAVVPAAAQPVLEVRIDSVVPAAELAEKGRKLALAQRGNGGLGKLALRTKNGGVLRIQAAGKRLPLATPEADEVSLAIALHEAGAPADAGRCAALRAPLRIDAKGARPFP